MYNNQLLVLLFCHSDKGSTSATIYVAVSIKCCVVHLHPSGMYSKADKCKLATDYLNISGHLNNTIASSYLSTVPVNCPTFGGLSHKWLILEI